MHFISKSNSATLEDWLLDLKEFQLDSMFDTAVLGRAFLVAQSVSIIESKKNEILAHIDSGRYVVEIVQDEGAVRGKCSCPYEGNCKHLAGVLIVLVA